MLLNLKFPEIKLVNLVVLSKVTSASNVDTPTALFNDLISLIEKSSTLLITLPFTTYSNSGYRGGITASFNSADFDNGFTEGRNRTHIDANVSYMQASFPFNDNGNWSSTGLTNAGVYDGFSVQASGTYISNA